MKHAEMETDGLVNQESHAVSIRASNKRWFVQLLWHFISEVNIFG